MAFWAGMGTLGEQLGLGRQVNLQNQQANLQNQLAQQRLAQSGQELELEKARQQIAQQQQQMAQQQFTQQTEQWGFTKQQLEQQRNLQKEILDSPQESFQKYHGGRTPSQEELDDWLSIGIGVGYPPRAATIQWKIAQIPGTNQWGYADMNTGAFQTGADGKPILAPPPASSNAELMEKIRTNDRVISQYYGNYFKQVDAVFNGPKAAELNADSEVKKAKDKMDIDRTNINNIDRLLEADKGAGGGAATQAERDNWNIQLKDAYAQQEADRQGLQTVLDRHGVKLPDAPDVSKMVLPYPDVASQSSSAPAAAPTARPAPAAAPPPAAAESTTAGAAPKTVTTPSATAAPAQKKAPPPSRPGYILIPPEKGKSAPAAPGASGISRSSFLPSMQDLQDLRQRWTAYITPSMLTPPRPTPPGPPASLPPGVFFNQAGLNAQARSESGGNPTARNPKSTASGKYQFLDRTWLFYQDLYNQRYGTNYNYSSAADAPEQVQDQVARITPVNNWGGPWAGSGGRNAANPAYLQNSPLGIR